MTKANPILKDIDIIDVSTAVSASTVQQWLDPSATPFTEIKDTEDPRGEFHYIVSEALTAILPVQG